MSHEDKEAIKVIRQEKGWGAKRIVKFFPNKGWCLRSVNFVIRRVDAGGSVRRKVGSGRKKTVRTITNIETVDELTSSQPGAPGAAKPRSSDSKCSVYE